MVGDLTAKKVGRGGRRRGGCWYGKPRAGRTARARCPWDRVVGMVMGHHAARRGREQVDVNVWEEGQCLGGPDVVRCVGELW